MLSSLSRATTVLSPSSMATDIQIEPSRYLRRIYKARTVLGRSCGLIGLSLISFSQPRKCGSLPELQIVPANRSLYVCRECSFANPHGELCLFCGGECAVSAQSSITSVRRRRISAPQPLNDNQKERLHLVHRRVAILRVPRQPASQLAADSSEGVLLSEEAEPPMVRRRRYRDAVIYTVDGVQADYLVRANELST